MYFLENYPVKCNTFNLFKGYVKKEQNREIHDIANSKFSWSRSILNAKKKKNDIYFSTLTHVKTNLMHGYYAYEDL